MRFMKDVGIMRGRLAPLREYKFLVVTSKHAYSNKKDICFWQDKPIAKATEHKIPLRYLLMTDADTGAIYGEIVSSADEPSLIEFAARAFANKHEMLSMSGIPASIVIPKKHPVEEEEYKHFQKAMLSLGITLIHPSSGFDAGVRCVRTWESQVAPLCREGGHVVGKLQRIAPLLSRYLSAGAEWHWKDTGVLWGRAFREEHLAELAAPYGLEHPRELYDNEFFDNIFISP